MDDRGQVNIIGRLLGWSRCAGSGKESPMHAHLATRCLLIGVAHGGEVDHVNTRLRRHDPTSERCQTPSEKSLKLINAAKVCAVRLDASESGLWVCSRRGCGQDSHSILPSSAAFLALIFFAFLGIFSFGRLCCSGCPSFVYHLPFACKKSKKKEEKLSWACSCLSILFLYN